MAKERKGYRRVRKGQGYVDRRSHDRDVVERLSKGLPKKRKGGFFNPKAKIDRSQIQVRKSKDPTPYHWRTNKTKRDMALAKRHRLEEKADLDRDRQWKKGQIDWRWHQYEATTGYDKYRYGKDLKKKYPAVGKAAKRRVAKGKGKNMRTLPSTHPLVNKDRPKPRVKSNQSQIKRARIMMNQGKDIPKGSRWQAAQNIAKKRMAKRRATPEWQAKHGYDTSTKAQHRRSQKRSFIEARQKNNNAVRNMNKAMSAFNPRKKQIKKAAVKRYRGASSSTSKRAI